MLVKLPLAMLALAALVLAQDRPAVATAPAPVKVEMTAPVFEMFRLAPSQTEAFTNQARHACVNAHAIRRNC